MQQGTENIERTQAKEDHEEERRKGSDKILAAILKEALIGLELK
jgi:hypothetical protein